MKDRTEPLLLLPGVPTVGRVAGALQTGSVPVARGSRAGRNIDDVAAPALRTFVVGHGMNPRIGSASGLYKHRERPR